MFEVYITMKFRLIRTETIPVGLNNKMDVEATIGTFSVYYTNYFQNVHERYLIPLRIRSVMFIIPV